MIEGDPTTKGLNVNIVGDDASIGGGTQYAVNAALGAAPTGTLALAKRDDALSALSPVEADAVELRVDGEGALWVIPSGTTTVDGTVTANAGTNLNTSALSTETSLAKLTIAQGAAIGTNTLAMVGGHVTTTAPTYTTAQISPLSLKTTGDLRVADVGITTILGEVQATPTANTVLARLKTTC